MKFVFAASLGEGLASLEFVDDVELELLGELTAISSHRWPPVPRAPP